jgi:hypothetical protein
MPGKSGKPAPRCAELLLDDSPCLVAAIHGSAYCSHHSQQVVARHVRELAARGMERVSVDVPRMRKPLSDCEPEERLAFANLFADWNPDLVIHQAKEAA